VVVVVIFVSIDCKRKVLLCGKVDDVPQWGRKELVVTATAKPRGLAQFEEAFPKTLPRVMNSGK
jgi:hypothetical protein